MLEPTLQQRLNSRIDEVITTLELRLTLNAKTIIPIENIFFNVSLDSHGAVPKPIAIMAQNERAQHVINECTVAIKKLSLLKVYIPKVESDVSQYFFNNYSIFTFKEFKQRLIELANVNEMNQTMQVIKHRLKKRITRSYQN